MVQPFIPLTSQPLIFSECNHCLLFVSPIRMKSSCMCPFKSANILRSQIHHVFNCLGTCTLVTTAPNKVASPDMYFSHFSPLQFTFLVSPLLSYCQYNYSKITEAYVKKLLKHSFLNKLLCISKKIYIKDCEVQVVHVLLQSKHMTFYSMLF